MPIDNISVKVNWNIDKIINPLVDIKDDSKDLGVGIYNANIDQSEPFRFKKTIRRVAVVGAGPAGVSICKASWGCINTNIIYKQLPTAKLLLDEGIEVKIYERNAKSGGTWIYNKEKPINPDFPSEIPSKVVTPSFPPKDSTLPFSHKQKAENVKEELLRLTPPTPCYRSLRNNVPTPLLKYKDLEWPIDTVSSNILIKLSDCF